ncbi:Uncharacterised protein r2_g3928 [Pycnogonum litorale]
MAVIQKNKAKVRPVMDIRELNSHVEAYTASADVCADKLREWRRQGTNVAIVDLQSMCTSLCGRFRLSSFGDKDIVSPG